MGLRTKDSGKGEASKLLWTSDGQRWSNPAQLQGLRAFVRAILCMEVSCVPLYLDLIHSSHFSVKDTSSGGAFPDHLPPTSD